MCFIIIIIFIIFTIFIIIIFTISSSSPSSSPLEDASDEAGFCEEEKGISEAEKNSNKQDVTQLATWILSLLHLLRLKCFSGVWRHLRQSAEVYDICGASCISDAVVIIITSIIIIGTPITAVIHQIFAESKEAFLYDG